jgi:hypothetical protein
MILDFSVSISMLVSERGSCDNCVIYSVGNAVSKLYL